MNVSSENLSQLQTEGRNPRTVDIDTLSTLEACRRMNDEDHVVAEAVQSVLPAVAESVDAIAAAFRAGGRTALTDAVEGAEDSAAAGAADVDALAVGPADVVAGITASGRTPYVLGALDRARERGAKTIGIANCDPAAITAHCDIAVLAVTGPEVITGSTRLKAGTAQKLVLNMLSTLAMVRAGKTYGNLMIDVMPTNAKLRDRARRILVTATGRSPEDAAVALRESAYQVKVAAVMLLADVDAAEATRRLEEADGFVAKAAG
jgi:N-acetylmuramic acid 6-phosphate etherase